MKDFKKIKTGWRSCWSICGVVIVSLSSHSHSSSSSSSSSRCWSPVECVRGRDQLDGRTMFRVELSVPATMTLDQRIFPGLDVHRTADVALVVPDHQIALQLTHRQSPSSSPPQVSTFRIHRRRSLPSSPWVLLYSFLLFSFHSFLRYMIRTWYVFCAGKLVGKLPV